MIRLNKNKRSKYMVYVGWGLTLFLDKYNELYFVQKQYGNISQVINV